MEIKKYLKNTIAYPHWKKIGIYDHHGFCFPLFSIRSKNSMGIGEFADLKILIDWLPKIKMDMLQILPINEIYFKDPSPYNAISSCALDPIYISLKKLPYIEKDESLQLFFKKFKKYNKTKKVKHDKVRTLKFIFFRKYFEKYFHLFENKKDFLNFKKNNPWLLEYSIFRTLKNIYKKKWYNWPLKYRSPTQKTLNELFKKYKKETVFYTFLQYLAFSELKKIKKYATSKNVLIKGDIPILINPDSHDVWLNRKIFNTNYIAGAPPDDFNSQGHKWGFPIFNWENIKKTDFAFWKQRLKCIEDIYHLYRIDHVVGFFRIWAILKSDKAAYGKFLPQDPKKWKPQGENNLNMLLDVCNILPIAEDLGFIPNIVYTTLKKLGIAGTKVPMWEKDSMHDYERLSLTTLSTHDTETLSLFWKNKKSDIRRLCLTNNWKCTRVMDFKFRKKILYDTHHSNSIFHINLFQEYLALFPSFVWKNKKRERINRSGVISKKNWTYRFRNPLEEITSNKELTKAIIEIVL